MQRYWEWLVGRVPSWIAPNLITIIGLATNVFTTLVLVYYCPTATEQVGRRCETAFNHTQNTQIIILTFISTCFLALFFLVHCLLNSIQADL